MLACLELKIIFGGGEVTHFSKSPPSMREVLRGLFTTKNTWLRNGERIPLSAAERGFAAPSEKFRPLDGRDKVPTLPDRTARKDTPPGSGVLYHREKKKGEDALVREKKEKKKTK